MYSEGLDSKEALAILRRIKWRQETGWHAILSSSPQLSREVFLPLREKITVTIVLKHDYLKEGKSRDGWVIDLDWQLKPKGIKKPLKPEDFEWCVTGKYSLAYLAKNRVNFHHASQYAKIGASLNGSGLNGSSPSRG